MAINLALWMATHGEKVLYVSCADMNWKDFIIRLSSIAFGIKFSEAYQNLSACYDNLKKLIGNNLDISINAAGQVSAEDIVEKVNHDNFSVCITDYDGTLAGAGEGDSMYMSYGAIYNELTKLSIAGKLVIVCSQPKNYAYGQTIGMSDIGESSKKQQVKNQLPFKAEMF